MSSTTEEDRKERSPVESNEPTPTPTLPVSSALETSKESPISPDVIEKSVKENEKAHLPELRKGMAGWQWTLFHAVVFFGALISGKRYPHHSRPRATSPAMVKY